MGEMPWDVASAAVERFAATSCDADGNDAHGSLREVIPSTMGEPLLYSHFNELLELCGKLNIPLNLTTNGTFPGVWKSAAGMGRLLRSCSDIKVSCMGFDEETVGEMMPGTVFAEWKRNVESLLEIRRNLSVGSERLATVSLQVTLHRRNVQQSMDILMWAESIGVHRIKWNPAVFLGCASNMLRSRYELRECELEKWRTLLCSKKVICEGSLFFRKGCGNSAEAIELNCPFEDELWILPDGSVEHCPNPERRFGDEKKDSARCEHCPMKH